MPDPIPARDAAFPPGATALLLVDMQRIWLDPAYAEDQDHADFYHETAAVTVPNCKALVAAARASGVEVLHTIIQSLTEDGRDRSLDHKMTPIHLARSDPRGLPVLSLMPAGDEIMLPKTSSGVFNSTNIDYVLRNLGVRTLVVCGIMTDQCVDMAVRDAADRGYVVVVPADACFAATRARHEQALSAFGGYCWRTDTATVADRFRKMRERA
ncbi:MAG: isochorismatase family cysteine hydrolase [Paracoccus sp. (in: a-proteobacteria)]|uniref:cysteine hydrolase family protein n=1 Tax=Paracoccus sp. TaxID=267 RepID=UPI0039E39B22